ncbi:MAG TPA: hypothetical protein VGB84_02160 [Arachidicoccus sp.]
MMKKRNLKFAENALGKSRLKRNVRRSINTYNNSNNTLPVQ